MTSSMRRVMVGVVALGLGAGAALAATVSWTNDAGGTFSDGANWEGGVPPAEGDLALFTNTATYTLSFTQPATNGEARFSASSGLVTVDLAGQVWRHTNLTYFGYTAGADSQVRAQNGELETKALQLGNISATAAGALTVAGATATVFGSSGLGIGMSGTGRVVVATDDAILRMTGGGTHLVGNNAGSMGSLLVSNGLLSVSGAVTVGSSGQGEFLMNQSTGLITGTVLLGSAAGSLGRLALANGGADLSAGGIRLGVSAGARGELYLSNGVLRTQGEAKLGEDGSAHVVIAGGTWLATTSGAINANLYIPFTMGTGRLVMASADARLVQTGNGSTIQLSNGTNGFGDLIMSNGMMDVNGIEIADGRATRAEMYVYNATCVVNRTGASALNVGDQSYSTGLLVVADSRAMIVVTNGTGIALGGQTANPGNSNAYGRVELSNGTLWVRGFRMAYGTDSSADATIGHGTLVNRTDTGIIVAQGLRSRATLVLAETDSLIDATNTASSSPMIVGNSTGSVGTVIMSNGTMRLSRLVVGNLGKGTVTLENQSTVAVTDNIYLPNNGTGSGNGTGVLVLASADATLTATSGTISVGASWSGAKSAVGQLIVSNGVVRTRILNVGVASDGLLTVLDGSILQGSTAAAEGLKIGTSSEAGTGTVVLAHANALVSLPSNTLGSCTAANAAGRLIISNGAVVVLGVQMGGTAATHSNSVSDIFIADGSLSTIQGTFQCGVGERTTARVLLQEGNSRLMHTNGTINLGSGAYSRGSLVVSNGTVVTRSVNMGGNTASSPVGQYGEWIIHNATNMLRGQGPGTAIWMAGQPNCTGLMVMAHAGAYVDTTNNVLVGDLGDGTLLVSNGLLVAANITMSSQTGSVGRMEMAGGRVAVGGTLVVGNRSAASLRMTGGELSATSLVLVGATTATNTEATLELSGGTLHVARVSAFAAVGARSNLWWSGGTMAALANFTNALGLTLTNSPGPGLATLDSAGFTVLQSGLLTGPGGLAKAGAGVLALSEDSDFTGETRVDAGTLALRVAGSLDGSTSITVAAGASLDASARSDGTLTVGAGQVLKGHGTVLGVVANGGTVAPGTSAGTLTVVADYSQSGALAIELGGTTPGSGHDVLAVASNAVLGGTLDVTLIGAFTPVSGNSFTVLTAGAVSGTFAATNLPALGGGAVWSVTYPAGAVVLTVTGGGAGPTAYEIWGAGYGLSGADLYNGADPDGDGSVNLLEYALGSNPTSGLSSAKLYLTVTNGTGRLLLQRVNSATDIVYYVEGSELCVNGASWSTLATNAAGVWSGPATVDDNNTGAVHEVRVLDTVSAGSNRFLRLRVTR